MDMPAHPEDGFLVALHADGPAPGLGAAADVYSWLIGRWDMDIVDYFPDGTRQEGRGEVHFAWVLEGRAIQDLWIGPPRGERGRAPHGSRDRYGTTIRVYDPDLAAWRVTWINPISHTEVRLVGRRERDRIVQMGQRDDGTRIRWTFSEITPDTFTWRGERSTDGESWDLEVEFFVRRRR